jgi:hypothetical protein
MSVQTGKTQYPPLPSLHAHPQSTSSHHHKHSLKARSRTSQFSILPNSTVSSTLTGFTYFQFASSISDSYEPVQSSPLFHSLSPSSSPSLPSHRSYHSLSASAMSTSTASTSIVSNITPAGYANNLPTLSQTKPPLRCADPSYSLPRPKRAQGHRRYLHASPAVS